MPNPTFTLGEPLSPGATAPTTQSLPPREIEREWQDPDGNLPPYTHLTMHDLPSEDPEESGLPDEFHDFQPALLRETCQLQRPDFFVGVDLNLYYDPDHPLWHKRPDWFLALGVAPARTQADLRLSYVFWQEKVSPFLVVELLSPSTEDDDLGKIDQKKGKPTVKWDVYEQVLKVPFYVIYDSLRDGKAERYENQLRVFALQEGRYQAMELSTPRFWFEQLGMGLGLWPGVYQGAEGEWLRWYDRVASPVENRASASGENLEDRWIPTAVEETVQANQRAAQEHLRAEQANQRAEQERLRAEQLAEKLRSLGIDPNQL
jgi:Uma2 family endonuclease